VSHAPSSSTAAATPAPDSGAPDSGTPDAGHLVLPLFRVGPRSSFQGGFGQQLTGTLSLPATAGVSSFDGWEVTSRVQTGTLALSPARNDGGTLEADLDLTITTGSTAPATDREVFSAVSPDGGAVLLATLDDQRQLRFSIESTALQALALAEVRPNEPFLFEAYYFGARKGDRPALDSAVPAVAAAMHALLSATGSTGVSTAGFARPGTPVFAAIDSATSTPSMPAPVVTPGASSQHLTSVATSGEPGTLAVWLGDGAPLPNLPVLAGRRTVPLFFYSIDPTGLPLYVRFRAEDGGQTPASAVFTLPGATATPPAGPEVTLGADQVTACNVTPGNQVVFFNSGTELAVGFAAVAAPLDGGCATLPRSAVTPDVGLLHAAQVTPQGLVGSPGNTLFP
jgi:hypothetical protein